MRIPNIKTELDAQISSKEKATLLVVVPIYIKATIFDGKIHRVTYCRWSEVAGHINQIMN